MPLKNTWWKPKAGHTTACTYCGEQISNKTKYCPDCSTQPKRKKIFDENVTIMKENLKTFGRSLKTLKDWK